MFFLKSNIPGESIVTGTPVSFQVTSGSKGPEAVNIVPTGHIAQGQVAVQSPQMPPPASTNSLSAARFYGTIKQYNFEKGWGHVDSEFVKIMYGKDMFFLKTALHDCPNPAPGDLITFTVRMAPRGP